ncbi:MAG: protein BatD [Saprospiraceae bacterium]|nr:protein BatD [Saprospiraceae bacterium]
MITRKLLILYLLLLLFPMMSFAQTGNAYVIIEPRIIVAGEYCQISIVLENQDAPDLNNPDLSPFTIVQGPSTSSSLSIINGKRSSSTKWIYTAKAPDRPGKYKIKPIKIRTTSGSVQTSATEAEVLAANTNRSKTSTAKGEGDFFVRLETDVKEAFPGQQILLHCRLYTKVNISSYEFLNEPSAQGVFLQKTENPQSPVEEVFVNNQKYVSKILRTYALYPQQTGELQINPIGMRFALDDSDDRQQSWGLFFKDYRYESAQTQAINIEVKELPLPAAPNFSGAVGKFTAELKPIVSTGSSNEALSLVLSVKGEGDLKRINQSAINWPETFETYGVKTTREEYMEGSESITGIKEFVYSLVPSEPGLYDISDHFVFFNAETQQYDSVQISLNQFEILNSGNVARPSGAVVERFDTVEPGIMDSLRESPVLLYSAIGVICLLLFGGIAYRQKQKQKAIQAKAPTQKELEKTCLQNSFQAAIAWSGRFVLSGNQQDHLQICR